MKSIAKKLLACTFVIALASGCASVTDASFEQAEQQKEEVVMPAQPDNPGFSSDQEMGVIYDKP